MLALCSLIPQQLYEGDAVIHILFIRNFRLRENVIFFKVKNSSSSYYNYCAPIPTVLSYKDTVEKNININMW